MRKPRPVTLPPFPPRAAEKAPRDPKPPLPPELRRAPAWRPDPAAFGRARPRVAERTVDDPSRDPATGAPLGGRVRVSARAVSRFVADQPESRRRAAEEFAAASEAVAVGGVAAAAIAETAGVGSPGSGGVPLSAQDRAVDQVSRLRRMEAAVGPVVLAMRSGRGKSPAALVPVIAALRSVAIDGASLRDVLAFHGLARSVAREDALRAELSAALGRIARAEGLEATPRPAGRRR